LAGVIALVLVLRHSIENRSISKEFSDFLNKLWCFIVKGGGGGREEKHCSLISTGTDATPIGQRKEI